METENQSETGAASSNAQTATSLPEISPKVEFKDGQAYMEVGGKMVKMVKESDLIAAKQSLEGKLETQQATHNTAMDAVKLELSAEQQKVANLNAKLTEAQNAQGEGATSGEDVARIKQELETANQKVETLTTLAGKSLELKKSLLIAQYPGVTTEQLENKTLEQLDSLEEALKTVASMKGGGIGPYATGGGMQQAKPLSDYDRRKAALEGAKVGSRESAA